MCCCAQRFADTADVAAWWTRRIAAQRAVAENLLGRCLRVLLLLAQSNWQPSSTAVEQEGEADPAAAPEAVQTEHAAAGAVLCTAGRLLCLREKGHMAEGSAALSLLLLPQLSARAVLLAGCVLASVAGHSSSKSTGVALRLSVNALDAACAAAVSTSTAAAAGQGQGPEAAREDAGSFAWLVGRGKPLAQLHAAAGQLARKGKVTVGDLGRQLVELAQQLGTTVLQVGPVVD